MQWRDSHEADDGRTVRVGHNSPFPQPDVRHGLGIDLRDDERHLGVHPEGRAVVHDDSAASNGGTRVSAADASSGAEERDIDPFENPRRREVLDGVLAVLEGDALARGALAGEEAEAAVGEVAGGDDAEELLPDGARGAHDGHGRAVLAERHADGGRPPGAAPERGRRQEVGPVDGGGGLHCGGGDGFGALGF